MGGEPRANQNVSWTHLPFLLLPLTAMKNEHRWLQLQNRIPQVNEKRNSEEVDLF